MPSLVAAFQENLLILPDPGFKSSSFLLMILLADLHPVLYATNSD